MAVYLSDAHDQALFTACSALVDLSEALRNGEVSAAEAADVINMAGIMISGTMAQAYESQLSANNN